VVTFRAGNKLRQRVDLAHQQDMDDDD